MTTQRKCCVIGIDGVPCTLLNDYIAEGLLPNMQKILAGGYRLDQMDASIPEVSSTSWTSFMTGVNPGEHGIYGFMDLRAGTYQMYFPNSANVMAPTIWEMTGGGTLRKSSTLSERYRGRLKQPLRSIILNIPQTYPALPLNGILTAGFVCPDFKKGTYPESAYTYLKSMGYLPDVDSAKAVDKQEEFFKELFLALEKRVEAFEHFLTNEQWDLFIGVITETDRLHHFFFDAARDPGHPRNAIFRTFYQKMDECIGRLYARFMELTGGEGLFLTLSDHGFTTLKHEVNINVLLQNQGLLTLDANRDFYDQIASGTTAFAMEPARIYINREGRYPRGTVKADAVADAADRVRAALEALRDDAGNPVIKAVYDGNDLYRGGAKNACPDLVCVPHDGFDLKGTLKKKEVFSKGHFRGMHTQHDAHCMLPQHVERNGKPHIEDLAGIILGYFAAHE